MKTITSKNIEGEKFNVKNTGKSVKFYDYDTSRTYVRKLWVDRIDQPYVWLNGEFRSISYLTFTENGLPFTIGNYGVC